MSLRIAGRVGTDGTSADPRGLGRRGFAPRVRSTVLLGLSLVLLVALLGILGAQRLSPEPVSVNGEIVLDDRAIDWRTGGKVTGPCIGCGGSGFPSAQGGGIRFPSFDARGDRLAYVGSSGSISVVDLASGVTTRTDACAGCAHDTGGIPPIGSIALSPDARDVAYGEDGRIRVVEVATGKVRDLVEPPDGQVASAPAWSPDGSTIGYMVGTPAHRSGGGIWGVPADGGSPVLLLDGEVSDPAWSPDGSRIAYLDTSTARRGLWVLDVTSGETRRARTDAGCFLSSGAPVWAPDGTAIAVGVTTQDGDALACTLWLVPPDGAPEGQRAITDGRASHAAWRPVRLTEAASG
jgi:Tol biopolymer transport system component